jgi:PGF-CTERM protein
MKLKKICPTLALAVIVLLASYGEANASSNSFTATIIDTNNVETHVSDLYFHWTESNYGGGCIWKYTSGHSEWGITIKKGEAEIFLPFSKIKEVEREAKFDTPLFGKYLFSIDTKFEEELNNSIISEELKKEFEKNRFPLSDNATVKKEEEEKEGVITDEKKFILRKGERELHVDLWEKYLYFTNNATISLLDGKKVNGTIAHTGGEFKGKTKIDSEEFEFSIGVRDVKKIIFDHESVPLTKIPEPGEKGVPGFEAAFAIAGLLAVAYLLRRRR